MLHMHIPCYIVHTVDIDRRTGRLYLSLHVSSLGALHHISSMVVVVSDSKTK